MKQVRGISQPGITCQHNHQQQRSKQCAASDIVLVVREAHHFSQNFLSETISLQPPFAIGKKAELSQHVQSDIRL